MCWNEKCVLKRKVCIYAWGWGLHVYHKSCGWKNPRSEKKTNRSYCRSTNILNLSDFWNCLICYKAKRPTHLVSPPLCPFWITCTFWKEDRCKIKKKTAGQGGGVLYWTCIAFKFVNWQFYCTRIKIKEIGILKHLYVI